MVMKVKNRKEEEDLKKSGNYTNYIAVFSKISLARLHIEIGNLQININAEVPEKDWTEEQENLFELLKQMRGI